jgi:hypothetical protein
MSATAAPPRVPAGSRSVLTGVAAATTGPVARRDVTWFARPTGAGAWERRGTVTTSTTGRFRLAVEPVVDTEYQFKLPSSPRYRTSMATATVTTYTHATDVHVAGPASVLAGDPLSLTITVTSAREPRAGVTVAVSRTVDGTVVTDRLVTDATGRATFMEAPAAATRYKVAVARQLPYESASTFHDLTITPAPADLSPGSHRS